MPRARYYASNPANVVELACMEIAHPARARRARGRVRRIIHPIRAAPNRGKPAIDVLLEA